MQVKPSSRPTWLRRLVASTIVVLVPVLAGGAAPVSAQSDEIEWRPGWCYEDEGLTLVMDFYMAPREQWPAGNTDGFDVRCLTGPGIHSLLPAMVYQRDYFVVPPRADVPVSYYNRLSMFWGIGLDEPAGGWLASSSLIDEGWNFEPRRNPDPVNLFVGFTYAVTPSPVPRQVPQFLPNEAGPGPGPGGRPPITPRPPSGGGGSGGTNAGGGGSGDPGSGGGGSGDAGTRGGGGTGQPAGSSGGGGSDSSTASDPDATSTTLLPLPRSGGDGDDTEVTAESTDDGSDDGEDAVARVYGDERTGTAQTSSSSGVSWRWLLLGLLVIGGAGTGVALWFRARRITTGSEAGFSGT